MRYIPKILIGSIVLVSIFLGSCKKQDIQKDETAAFLSSLNGTATDLQNTQALNVLSDFLSKNPPIEIGVKKVVKFKGNTYNLPLKIETKGLKGGIEDYYGTWEWQDTGWVHIDPNNPQDGILFRWIYFDESSNTHQAEILIDSIELFIIDSDTLPKKLHVALYLDGTKIAELSFNAQYNSAGQITYLSAILTVVNEFQIGLEAKNLQYDQDGELVSIQLHLWIIDYRNHNFRRDITVTLRNDESISFLYTDSDDWKLTLNVSAPTQVTENFITYNKRTVSGEITKDNRHAADITGTIWEPEDENHQTQIYVIFSDGSQEPLSNYITFLGSK
uniref:Lipoprotein n=1 Tax=candidate division WOR-3 bacterium TaxID=2052148 RepID=A0A7C2P3Z8_UNCW3